MKSRKQMIQDAAQDYGMENYRPDLGAAAADGFEQGVQWADEHPAWIPTSERDPKDGQEVLYAIRDGVYNFKMGLVKYRDDLEMWIVVDYWKPLVQPNEERDGYDE